MKFDFKLRETVAHSDTNEISELDVIKELIIDREEILTEYAKDDRSFFMTLRELIYMFHTGAGYMTQLTDNTMMEMYQEIKDDPSIKGICFSLLEQELLDMENEFSRSHMNTIRLKVVR